MRTRDVVLFCLEAAALGALAVGFDLAGATAPLAATRPPTPPESYALLAGAGADALFGRLTTQVASSFDSARGGWVSHGAPDEASVALAFSLARQPAEPAGSSRATWRSRGLVTVNWTWGLFDSVGGGFLQRIENTRRTESSFEKRTDSNSARLENLIDAWQVTGDRNYGVRAAQVADYMDRVLLDARGGFVDGQGGDRDLVPRSNGMAIHAWLEWAAANADARPRDFALKSLDRVWTECWHVDLGMLHHDVFGDVHKAPQLEDQVEMGRAYLLGSWLGGRPVDLERAKTIGEFVERYYVDAKKGSWRTQAVPEKSGKIRGAASVPGENARAALFFAELAGVTGESRWRDAARRGIDAFSGDFDKAGPEAADWALAVRALGASDLPAKPEWQVETTGEKPAKKQSKRYR
jgi:uncharacterized protein YyaL (SSP411 family)